MYPVNFLRLVASALLITMTATAHDIITTNLTFARDISRIFARHCVACHAAGSSIPLTTYEEARPWAVSIKEQVLARSMPPWGAVKGFGQLSPDYGLSQEDIMIIAAWVVGGAPKGNTQLLPALKAESRPVSKPPAQDGVIVQTRMKLKEAIEVCGIRPVTETPVESARLIARLPDGRIEPLVWLYHFDPKLPRTFTFRKPLKLPEGTVVESLAPLRFALAAAASTSCRKLERLNRDGEDKRVNNIFALHLRPDAIQSVTREDDVELHVRFSVCQEWVQMKQIDQVFARGEHMCPRAQIGLQAL